MKILICDDKDANSARASVEAGTSIQADPLPPEIHQLSNHELKDWIEDLFASVGAQISGEEFKRKSNIELNGFDIVILDYGLTQLSSFTVRLTADMIAGYIRAFTDIPYVISLNKNPAVDFDLKYLVGDFDTKADLALNTGHLAVPGLWSKSMHIAGTFCPWYWPELRSVAARRREQIRRVKEKLDEPILDALGMPDAVRPFLSRQAVAFLHPEADEQGSTKDAEGKTQEVTFWNHFQKSNRTLPKNDRVALLEKFGGLEADKAPDDDGRREIIARVVAAELDFWFRRDVLGPQTVLIDTPHLQGWLRYRTGNEETIITAANQTVTEIRPENYYGLEDEVFSKIPPEALFVDGVWTDSPAFWLPIIEAEEAFERLLDSKERRGLFVFCEDTRRFVQRANAQRFVTELTKGIDVRFVERPSGADAFSYSPAVQFAL